MPNSFVADRLMYAVSKVMQQARLFYSRASSDYDEDRLWYELVACFLGSQVPFELAQAAASHLNEEGLLDFQRHDMSYCAREQSISAALSKPIFPPITKSGVGRKYRYPNTKALQIRKTAEAINASAIITAIGIM